MNTPSCPRCQAEMEPADREPRTTEVIGLRVGSPPPRTVLKVWRCTSCGIERPRFD